MKPISIYLDRLAAALSAQNVTLKRSQLLEVAAAAFGYHNQHEATAASQNGGLTPRSSRSSGNTSHERWRSPRRAPRRKHRRPIRNRGALPRAGG